MTCVCEGILAEAAGAKARADVGIGDEGAARHAGGAGVLSAYRAFRRAVTAHGVKVLSVGTRISPWCLAGFFDSPDAVVGVGTGYTQAIAEMVSLGAHDASIGWLAEVTVIY